MTRTDAKGFMARAEQDLINSLDRAKEAFWQAEGDLIEHKDPRPALQAMAAWAHDAYRGAVNLQDRLSLITDEPHDAADNLADNNAQTLADTKNDQNQT